MGALQLQEEGKMGKKTGKDQLVRYKENQRSVVPGSQVKVVFQEGRDDQLCQCLIEKGRLGLRIFHQI